MSDKNDLSQWLHNPLTEKLLAFFKDRKDVVSSMVINGSADFAGYKTYCGEWKGLGWLDIFISEERERNRDGS